MELGKVITEKRKELGLTQAQIAEYLGVTAPAVNRWEKDISVPDAGLLAPLARLLKTDLNELFSFYEKLSDIEVEKISSNVGALVLTGNINQALEDVEELVHSNPSDGRLHYMLAMSLQAGCMCTDEAEKMLLTRKSAELFLKSIELDPPFKDESLRILVEQYSYLGEFDKAELCWEQISTDKSWLHVNMLEGQNRYDEAIQEMKSYLLNGIIDLTIRLGKLRDLLLEEADEKGADLAREKQQNMIDEFGLWNYMFDPDNNDSGVPLSLSECSLFEHIRPKQDGFKEDDSAIIYQKMLDVFHQFTEDEEKRKVC